MILQVFYCVKPNTIRNIVALLFDQSKNIPMENKTQTPDKIFLPKTVCITK